MTQAALFPDIPVEASPSELSREDRLNVLARVSDRVGGLLPISAIPEILGVSRARVYQLIDKNQLEKIHFEGITFISGRSIKAWENQEVVTGRGHKRIGFWRGLVIGARIADSFEAALSGDPQLLPQ